MQSGTSLSELWSDGLKHLGRRPIVLLTIACLLGIVWADWAVPPLPVLVALLALAVVVASVALLRNLPAINVFLLLGFFLLGATLHTCTITPEPADLPPANAHDLPLVQAVVARVVPQGDFRQLALLSDVTVDGKLIVRRAQVSLPAKPPLRIADLVTLGEVSLWRPESSGTPGEFDSRRALARDGVHAQGRAKGILRVSEAPSVARSTDAGVAGLRRRMIAALTAAMPGPDPQTYAELLASMVYGIRVAPVPKEVAELFRTSGTMHLLVVSGTQVSVLVAALIFLIRGTRRVLPWWGIVGAIAAMAGLALVAGMGVSINRAVVMAVILLGSFAAGRQYDVLTAAALSALALCLLSTATVFEAGAQLTYACCLGVYLTVPRRADAKRGWRRLVHLVCWGTFGAWLFSSPIIINQFHRLVLTGGLANLVAVPLSVLLLYLGIGAIGLGMIWAPFALPLCGLARVLLDVILHSNRFFSSLPLAGYDNFALPWYLLLAWYAGAGVFLWALNSPTPRELAQRAGRRTLLAATLGLVGVTVLGVGLARLPSRQMQVDVLDVGAGQCVLVRAPGGHTALLDAGTEPFGGGSGSGARRRVLPFLALQGVRSLDAIVLSHPHEDHCNLAAEIMNAIPTRQLLCGPELAAEASWPVVLQTARGRGVQVQTAQAGGRLSLGEQCRLEFLEPRTLLAGTDEDSNNNSLVERLQFGAVSVLLPADLQAQGEQRLVSDYEAALKSDVMLAAHHASLRSNTPEFVRAVDPSLVIISCGDGSRRPDPRALQVFGNRPVWRTDVSGTIHLTTDGQRVRVRGYRGG